MFRTIIEYTSLDQPHARAWWQALSNARWSVPRSWLADVRYFDAQPRRLAKLDAVPGWLQTVSPPGRVVEVLEALVQEGCLARYEANVITERVLACVNRRGEWFWSPSQERTVYDPREGRTD